MTGIKRGHLHSDVAYQVQYRTVKLLQFHENYRPAFFGTWARKTMSVRGRNPFGKDSVVLDYENDSEEEWEEEEEGMHG